MRTALLHAVAAAAFCTLGAAASAQTSPVEEAPSTGYDLSSRAQALVDATRAGIAFGVVPDTRFRVVQHLETGFNCAFLPSSEAAVAVIAVDDFSKIGDDTICIERIDSTENAYRISQFPGETIEQVFEKAKANAGGWLSGALVEVDSAPNLLTSPTQPNVSIEMPRMQATFVGESADGPAMLRVAVARRPGDWYITQNYFAPLTGMETAEQQAVLAGLGSAIAEGAFAIRLGELLSPTVDPAILGALNPSPNPSPAQP